MANKSTRPFLPFVPGPKNKLRVRVRGGGAKSRDSVAEHGQALLRQIEAFQELVNTQTSGRAPDLPPLPDEIQVILETQKLPPERVGSLGFTPIEEREDGILVTVSPNATLATLINKTQAYISERTESDNPRYNGVIAPLDQIRPADPSDKMGDRLAEWINTGRLQPHEPLWVDIELAGGRTSLGEQNRQQFYDYINNLNGSIPAYAEERVTATSHFLLEEDYSLHRVRLPGRAIEDLLNDSRANWILLIDLVPEIEDKSLPVTEVAGGAIPPLPTLPANAPRVVIIDSGIAAEHPLFRDEAGRTIIGRQINFLPGSVEPAELTTDEVDQGHGTAVASVAAYGSVKDFVLDHTPAAMPAFWVENAKIMLPSSKLDPAAPADQPQLHPTQFPKTLMREIVAAFHQQMPDRCKIFTLALGSAPHQLQAISNWAEELDNLSAHNDVLFIVGAGNLPPAEIVTLIHETGDYPGYLFDQRARLRNPAQAYHAIAVGAVTDTPAPFWKSHHPMAPAQHPAPFSRSGLLHNQVVKPDVVEVGGNLSRDGQEELKTLPELAILVANRNFTTGQAGQPLGFRYGADMAAPKVAHLAGHIQAQHPGASANLIRGLIINSADWPELSPPPDPVTAVATPAKDAVRNLLRLCGYGIPQADKALSANDHCMVFIAEDEFNWASEDVTPARRYPGKVSFFLIRFEPDDIFRLPPGAQVRISVTLAYNPPVRKTRRRHYQGIGLRWELKRRHESSEEFRIRWMAEAQAEEEEGPAEPATPQPQPWPWQLKPVLNPGNRFRRGTVIRDWFDIPAHELPPDLEIAVLAAVAPWRKVGEPLRQPFALVVSIESQNPGLPIYDVVRVMGEM